MFTQTQSFFRSHPALLLHHSFVLGFPFHIFFSHLTFPLVPIPPSWIMPFFLSCKPCDFHASSIHNWRDGLKRAHEIYEHQSWTQKKEKEQQASFLTSSALHYFSTFSNSCFVYFAHSKAFQIDTNACFIDKIRLFQLLTMVKTLATHFTKGLTTWFWKKNIDKT